MYRLEFFKESDDDFEDMGVNLSATSYKKRAFVVKIANNNFEKKIIFEMKCYFIFK